MTSLFPEFDDSPFDILLDPIRLPATVPYANRDDLSDLAGDFDEYTFSEISDLNTFLEMPELLEGAAPFLFKKGERYRAFYRTRDGDPKHEVTARIEMWCETLITVFKDKVLLYTPLSGTMEPVEVDGSTEWYGEAQLFFRIVD